MKISTKISIPHKVVNVYGRSGLIKFTSPDMAKRALKRLNGEDVFGNRIIVSEKNNEIDISPKKRRPVNEDSKFTSSYASALSGTKVRFFKISIKNNSLVTTTFTQRWYQTDNYEY